MCIKLVQSGYFKVNDGGDYLNSAVKMKSVELVTELLKCEPTKETLLRRDPYDKADMFKLYVWRIKEYEDRLR
jgi:hypothetical protein